MEIPIKLNLPDQQAVDPLGQALENVVVASSGVRLVPGVSTIVDSGEGVAIDGIYNWEEQELVVVVCNGKAFKISNAIAGIDYLLLEDGFKLILEDGSGFLALEQGDTTTDVTSDSLVVNQRATFANYGDILYIANGSTIKELHPSASVVTHGGSTYTCIKNNIAIEPGVTAGWSTYWSLTGTGGSAWVDTTRYGSGLADALEDAQAPVTVSFVATADKYLLALETGSGRMHYSVVQEPWSFDADYVEAEHLPDDANCLQIFNGDVWIGGRRSIESFVNGGVSAWVVSGYGAINAGVLAPYTFLAVKGSFLWIDETKRLVSMSGREPVSLNETLDTYLNDLTTINDATADTAVIDGIEYYILTFPTEEKTIFVNLDNGSWSERTTGASNWSVQCVTQVPLWGMVLGGASDGTIKEIKSSVDMDGSEDISGIIRTPRIQTPTTLRAARLIIGLTRVADVAGSGSSSIGIRWRDDGGDWTAYRTVTVDHEKTDHVVNLYRCGAYRYNRQYELDLSDIWPFAVQKVEQL